MCILLLWDERLSLYISVKSISSRALFNGTISLLVFCLEDLSIFDSGVLKSPTIIVVQSISFSKSSKIFFMYLGVPMLGAYIFTIYVFLVDSGSLFMALFWKSILSDISIATCVFFFPSIFLENLFPALLFQSM